MGYSIFQYKDNGVKYAIQSSMSDQVVAYGMNQDELIEWWGENAKQRAINELKRDFEFFLTLPKTKFRVSYTGIDDSKVELKKAIRTHLRQKNFPKNEKKLFDGLKKLLKRLEKRNA